MTDQPHTNDTARAAWQRASRHYQAWRAKPSWVHRVAAGAILLILLGLAAILLVSSLVVGIVIAALGAVALGAAALVRRLRGQPSAGRRNVRIIVRQQP